MSAVKCSEIDIRLPVIITSFRRQMNPQQSVENNQNCSQNSVNSARLKNQSSFGGETSSTSITAESRSNSVVRKLNDHHNHEPQSLEAAENCGKTRRKSDVHNNSHSIGTVHYAIQRPNQLHYSLGQNHDFNDHTSIPLLSTPNGDYSQLIL